MPLSWAFNSKDALNGYTPRATWTVTASSPAVALLGVWFAALGLVGLAHARDHRGWLTRMVDRRAAMGIGGCDLRRDRRQQQLAGAAMAVIGIGIALVAAAVLAGRLIG